MPRNPCWPAAVLILALVLTACSTRPGTAPSVTTPTPPAQGAPLDPTPTTIPRGAGTAASLFPDSPRSLTFTVWDQGVKEAAKVQEQLIPDGDHVIATYGGKPYATWAITATGIWRLDPKGGGAMLRYLPPVLKDGETWQQASGEATVAFHLQTGGNDCRSADGKVLPREGCWTLTVLNRGERTTYMFTPGLGPTAARSENFAHPDASYFKELDAVPTTPISDADVAAARTQAPPVKETNTPLTPLDLAAFYHVVDQYPGVKTATVNLKGDGGQLLRGVLDGWTPTSMEIFDRNFTPLDQITPVNGGLIKVHAQKFPGDPRSFVLLQKQQPGAPARFTILAPYHGADSPFVITMGWNPKDMETFATAASVQEDGQVVVTWEMGDPAQHTRIRHYRFDTQGLWATVLTERYVPSQGELRYPNEPRAVLHAAFIARWFDLKDELPRYFATPQAAEAFQRVEKLYRPPYDLGSVSFATLSAPTPPTSPQVIPAKLDANHTAPFVVEVGEYEGTMYTWGTVTFGQDAQGRWVIQRLQVNDSQYHGL